MGVGVNPPKTPVTKGSNGIAMATLPNICKMPGPPAPFVPAPLPNIGKSGKSSDKPKDYSKKVKIENQPVAIKGASFGSMGDMASKGTGGGMLSANTHGPCKFIGPGSMDVKFESKNVQLLTDPMSNNGGGSGSPANSATMVGLVQLAEAFMCTEKKSRGCLEGDNNHTWVHEEATDGRTLDEKIDKKERSTNPGDNFEAKAAKHNRKDKVFDRGSQMSDQDVRKAGSAKWKCSVCGHEREADQLHDNPNSTVPIAVEVKAKKQMSTKMARQLGRNCQAAQQGGASGVIYKIPASTDSNPLNFQLENLSEKSQELLGVVIKIVRI